MNRKLDYEFDSWWYKNRASVEKRNLHSFSGYQELEVQANTLTGAKQQLERIYGAEQISNLREVRSGSSLSSSDGNVGGYLILGAILFGIWLIVEYWWIVIPVAVIIGILAYIGMKEE